MPIIVDAGTAVSAGYLTSNVLSSWDVLEPQYYRELIKRFGDQYTGLFDVFGVLQRRTPVAGNSWKLAEENRYYPTVTITSFAGGVGSAASPIAATILTGHALRAKQEILFADETIGYVQSISGNTAQIVSVNGETLPAIATNTELAIISNAWGGGTAQPTSLKVGVSIVEFYTQIFKETIGIDGDALTLQKWFDVKNTPTGPTLGVWTPMLMQAEARLNRQIDGALMWGKYDYDWATDVAGGGADQLVVPAGEDGAGNLIYLTKGFVPHVRDRGLTHEIPASGGFNGTGIMDDLDEIALYLKQNGVSSGYAILGVGPSLDSRIQDDLKDWNNGGATQGGVDYKKVVKSIFHGKDDLALSVNFQIIYRQGITFIVWVMDGFSDPTGMGLGAYNAMNMGFVFPVARYFEPQQKLMVDNLSVRYRALDGYSRFAEMWTNGAAGGAMAGKYIGQVDALNTYWRSHLGLQCYKANQMVILDPTGTT